MGGVARGIMVGMAVTAVMLTNQCAETTSTAAGRAEAAAKFAHASV